MSTPRFKKEYYHYNPSVVTGNSHLHLAGIPLFQKFFRMVANPNVVMIDRNNFIKTPVRTKLLFEMPKFRPINKTYEEICDERAVELLKHADKLDLPIYVFYSGGIDSTLVMVSLIKNATPLQMERITVLLTQDSIGENMNFYQEHLIGKVKLKNGVGFPFLLNKKAIFICGEFNDQLFGSDILRDFSIMHGPGSIQGKFNRELFYNFWVQKLPEPETVNFYLDLLEGLRKIAPMPIDTNADFLWWMNFSIKWQSVFMRILTYTSDFNLKDVDHNFIKNHFFLFFGTEDFQLWSMNNNDKKILDSWTTYKFTAKDVIYKFDKNDDYRKNKTKRGSLWLLILHQRQMNFVDEDFKMYVEQPSDLWYEPKNSFNI